MKIKDGNICCGNCRSFMNEDARGVGHCKQVKQQSNCADYCKRWEDKINRTEIHKKAIEYWGKEEQIKKCREELKELSDELYKFLKTKGDRRKLISEMADVLNTLEQQCFIHNILPSEIQKVQDEKMIRTLEIIKNK